MLLMIASLAYADLHFLAVGDWGGLPFYPWCTPGQQRVAVAMATVTERHSSDFVLSLGDHFYFHGVTSADDARWRRSFERVYHHEALQGAGFWRVVAGNHDHDGSVDAQLEYAARPDSRWYYPAHQYAWRSELGDEAGTAVDFVMLDTVLLCGLPRRKGYRHAEAAGHWRWAEAALRGSDAAYLVVAGHYPVHSPSMHGPTACLRRRLEPLLAASGAAGRKWRRPSLTTAPREPPASPEAQSRPQQPHAAAQQLGRRRSLVQGDGRGPSK